jgi:PBSX family phage terminase large subunit
MKDYFILNKTQLEVFERIQTGKNKYIALYGGGRSGKTTLILFIILLRAIRFPKSTHLIVRATHNSMKSSIYYQSFGKLLNFYNVKATTTYKRNDQDLTIKLENGSVIQMKGLDHERRQESLLGNEYSTIYFNECSSLNYSLMPSLISRLAENICDINQVFFDFNPPTKAHWTYKYFIQQIDPTLQIDLPYKNEMFIAKINPVDNPHIASDYIDMQKMQGTSHYQRFVEGEFQDVGGMYIQRDFFGSYNEEIQDIDFIRLFMTTDFAKSKNVKSDYNVLCVWGVDKERNLYLLDTDRFQAVSVDELPRLHRLYEHWKYGFNNGGAGLYNIYIEKPSNQDLIALLQRQYGNIINTDVMRSSNKFGRFSAVRSFIEMGKVFFPSGDLFIRNIKVSTWLDTYLTELESFTDDDKDYEHDDFCDNVFDACYIANVAKVRRPLNTTVSSV